jgi:hypothetical protein
MKDLGYANGWQKTPEIVEHCQKKDHVVEGEVVGNCLVERWCPICDYYYRIDSSG